MLLHLTPECSLGLIVRPSQEMLPDLLGGYLPILALVLLCGLGAIDVIEWTYVGLPLFLSEAIAFFLLRQRMKTAPEPHFEK